MGKYFVPASRKFYNKYLHINMQLFGKVTVILFSVFALTSSANEFDRLKLRVKHLETRLNTEFTFRDEDIAEITGRLDDIDKVLNATIGKQQPIPSAASKAGDTDFETVDTLKEDFTRLRSAFTEEKTEIKRLRREIPKIENNLISLNKDVKDYCEVAVNNTDHLLTSFEKVQNVHKDIINTPEIKALESMADQVQLNTKQIENIETLVTVLLMHSGYSFSSSPCDLLRKINQKKSKIYNFQKGLEIYCDQTTDGGGWVVFQRRLNGKTDFYRNWTDYKNGFGDLNGEFWLGNEHLSLLTSDGGHELRIDMEDFEGNSAYAKYSKFKVYPEEDNYRLEVSGYSGTAGDSLRRHNGAMFSTYDRDHDTSRTMNCAKSNHGAWWYNSCHYSNLNGQYYNQPGKMHYTGINWWDWKKKYYSLKKVEMKFR
ncbi:fibrinogen-like protein 1 [Ruditapes philippinarum]|uniref:fibrinogen-like protein 1 n=1 Tax=Ruditapes philippinarum TaxID=129788 RepID=UPI00295BA001|nr:fibrinogen-like protein 1 [Ruditapes philippinarum]